MNSILEHNPMIFKNNHGFDYPQFVDFYKKTRSSVWTEEEVKMESDLRDWQFNSTPEERAVIAGILKGFVSAELGIGCYWADRVCKIFPKPEIQAMARAFSFFETIHAFAYSYLNDVLGLNEYEEFVNDPVACSKIETFFNSYSDKVSLAVFSGAGEGVSLFSSFAVLLSFSKDGRYYGLKQLISWSALDEQNHSDAGCELFKELVKETGLSSAEKEKIYQGIDLVVQKEFAFIDNIFKNKQINSIDSNELKGYIKRRANDRVNKLGLKPLYILTEEEENGAKSIADWFDPMVIGASDTDFFAMSKSGGNYIAKPTQDFSKVNFKSLDLDACLL